MSVFYILLILIIVVVAGSTVVSRFLTEKALRSLDASQKLQLIEGFSSFRKWSSLPTFALLIAFVAAVCAFPRYLPCIINGVWGLFVAYRLGLDYLVKRRLTELDFPPKFIRNSLLALRVNLAVITIAMVLMSVLMSLLLAKLPLAK